MSDTINSLLGPGTLVRNSEKPEWGVGQVQSNISGKVTVNFEHMGKITIMGSSVRLVIASQKDDT